ncbi:MAG TPA: hypothetical protein VMF08_06340 [Candidatus Sulfotelmatobacter sp.]|nr:hypothetical protein [Candidatus Sulfotelmatobacter sp.]
MTKPESPGGCVDDDREHCGPIRGLLNRVTWDTVAGTFRTCPNHPLIDTLVKLCRQLMLGPLAMLLSLFMHPAIAGALAFFAGNGFYSPTDNPLYYLLPSYAPFNVFEKILTGSLMNENDVVLLTLYAADFIVLMLLLAWWRFQSKEVC